MIRQLLGVMPRFRVARLLGWAAGSPEQPLQPSLPRQQQSRTDGRMAGQAISDGRTGHHPVRNLLDVGQGIQVIVRVDFIQDVHGILVNEVDLGVNTRMERPCPLTHAAHANKIVSEPCSGSGYTMSKTQTTTMQQHRQVFLSERARSSNTFKIAAV
jgi:hypothetical protein